MLANLQLAQLVEHLAYNEYITGLSAYHQHLFIPTLQGEVASSWNNTRLVVAHDLIDRLSEKLGLPLTALGSLTGAQLAGCQYRHPLFDRTSPVVIGGDYITTESGTGLVHTAPGHGQEDYQVSSGLCSRFNHLVVFL